MTSFAPTAVGGPEPLAPLAENRPQPLATLADRVPAQAVLTKLLETHQAARPRRPLARLAGRSPLSKDTGSWYVGALGEIAVARTLAKLPQGWQVRHAVPVGTGDSDIDHVVVGPAGVFTINTKHHPGQPLWVAGRTFMVAGSKQPYIRNAEHEARRAAKILSTAARFDVPVTPVIALVGVDKLTVKERPAEVRVMSEPQLLGWLTSQPVVLSSEQLQQVIAAADRPATWQANTGVSQDRNRLVRDFDRLRREVRSARRVRAAWSLGTPLAGAAALLTWSEEVTRLLQGVLAGL